MKTSIKDFLKPVFLGLIILGLCSCQQTEVPTSEADHSSLDHSHTQDDHDQDTPTAETSPAPETKKESTSKKETNASSTTTKTEVTSTSQPNAEKQKWADELRSAMKEYDSLTRPCQLEEKMTDIAAFLIELEVSSPLCMSPFLDQTKILRLYSPQFYQQFLVYMRQLDLSSQLQARTNYLRMMHYFFLFEDASTYSISIKLKKESREIARKYVQEYDRETLLKDNKKYDVSYYEFLLISHLKFNDTDSRFLGFLSFLHDCTLNGLSESNQSDAAEELLEKIELVLIINPKNPVANSESQQDLKHDVLEWYVELLRHPNKIVQTRTIQASRGFIKSDEWVRNHISEALLKEVNSPTMDYWNKIQAVKIIIQDFQITQDLQGQPLDFDQEREKCIAKFSPNMITVGNVSYQTRRDVASINQIHGQLMKVQKVFIGLTQLESPQAGDKNDALKIVIFDTEDSYQQFSKIFLEQYIGDDTRGFYIEKTATIYTHESNPENEPDQTYIVNVLKHEYTHYLSGRYITPGIWGNKENPITPVKWFEEGLAELLAGVTPEETITLRSYGLESLQTIKKGIPLSSILKASHSSSILYTSSHLFLYFLYTQHKDVLEEVVRSLAASTYRFESYTDNSITSTLGTDMEALEWEFEQFLTDLINQEVSI